AFVVALGVAAQDAPKKNADPKAQQKEEPGNKKDDVKNDGKGEEPAQPPEDPQEIIKRLRENFEKARKGLEDKDATERTQTTQKKIIEDIDKLLDQQNDDDKNGGGGGGGGG